jgi:hypothetical protein
MKISVIQHQQCFLIHMWPKSSNRTTSSIKFREKLTKMSLVVSIVILMNRLSNIDWWIYHIHKQFLFIWLAGTTLWQDLQDVSSTCDSSSLWLNPSTNVEAAHAVSCLMSASVHTLHVFAGQSFFSTFCISVKESTKSVQWSVIRFHTKACKNFQGDVWLYCIIVKESTKSVQWSVIRFHTEACKNFQGGVWLYIRCLWTFSYSPYHHHLHSILKHQAIFIYLLLTTK